MSSRQLRKLQKQRELEQQLQAVDAGAEDDSDEEPEPAPTKPRVSLFAALGGDDDNENDSDDHDGADAQDSHAAVEKEVESEAEAVPQPAKKSKKKKKKSKKRETSNKDEPQDESKEQDDEIDRALRELSLARESGPPAVGNLAQHSRGIDELLQINAYHLKAINEMRNLFGKEAIDAAEQEERDQQAAETRRQGRQGPRQLDLEQALRGHPRQKLPEISLRRNIFIQGRDYWPRATAAGLTMKEIKKGADGVLTEFTFHHDSGYDKTQVLFFHMVQMGEPMNMVSLLREQPYHITTLLQVSKVAAQDQNPALAAELCERALFTFGRVTTSAFRQKLEQGKARLDFRRPENREFWLAGYHYLKSLVRKGTYRTALEWAKLLYSLNPNDPYAMKNFIHPLAIKAQQAQWFVDFCESSDFTGQHPDDEYMKQSMIPAYLQLGDADKAKSLAVAGMARLPWLYCALFQELNLDPPPPLWGVKPPGDSQYWTNIYLNQAKDLWDNSGAIAVLKEAVQSAQKVDVKSLPSDMSSDLRTARFAFLEGNTKLIAGVPRSILAQQPNYEFDPLPPALGDNIFSSEGVRLPWAEQSQRENGLLETPQGRAFFERLRRQMERQQQRGGAAGLGAGEDDDEEDFGDPFDMIPDEEFDNDGNRGWGLQDDQDDQDDQDAHARGAEAPTGQEPRDARPRGQMPGGGDTLWDDGDNDDNGNNAQTGAATGTAGGGLQRLLTNILGSVFGSRDGGQADGGQAETVDRTDSPMPGGLPEDHDGSDHDVLGGGGDVPRR